MGLVLNKTSGKASGLTEQEVAAVHEILTWGRQPGNNKVFSFFQTVCAYLPHSSPEADRTVQECLPRRVHSCPKSRNKREAT